MAEHYADFSIFLNIDNTTKIIRDLNINMSANDFYQHISKSLEFSKLPEPAFRLYYGGNMINSASTITLVDFGLHANSTVELMIPMVGGNIIGDLIDAIIQIYEFFKIIPKLLKGLIKLIVWLIQFFLWFLIDFCNPLNLATDFIGGITKITRLLFAVMSDAFFGALKFFFNMFITPIFSGFWGWDSVLSEKEKEALTNTPKQSNGDVKLYKPPHGQVSFTVILATILLPPMGLFMEFGLTSWINIVICGILTMVYYFPGLIYALILIYAS
jgi:uncharacterized membrane protein YqaE (UPF0057 family)